MLAGISPCFRFRNPITEGCAGLFVWVVLDAVSVIETGPNEL
jgi:hypothetical protein